MVVEFKEIEEFYNQCLLYVKQIKQMAPNSSTMKQIEFSRKYYKSNILNSYIKVGLLNKEQEQLLNTKNRVVKFSVDSLIKNMLKHPEIKLEEYLYISKIINNPDKIALSKSNNNSILIFKFNDNYYQIVIKSTNNKSENYLTSFIRSNEKEYNRY